MKNLIPFFLAFCWFSLAKKPCFHDDRNFRCVQYVRNYDGDTIVFNIPNVHSLIGKKIRVRVHGINTPEIKTKDECERKKAESARLFTFNFLKNAKRIDLINIQRGNYFRIVADIRADGQSLGAGLLKMNLASRFGKKNINWCKKEIVSSQKKSLNILILGNSLTAGYGVETTEAFPHQLENLLNRQFKNYKTKIIADGISGSTSAGASSRLKKYIPNNKPEIVLIALGGNDGLRGLPVQSLKDHLQSAIDLAISNQIKVVLSGMKIPLNYGEKYRQSFERVYRELAEKNQLIFIPFILKKVGMRSEYNLPDGIHPNPVGHKIITQTILPYLEDFYK